MCIRDRVLPRLIGVVRHWHNMGSGAHPYGQGESCCTHWFTILGARMRGISPSLSGLPAEVVDVCSNLVTYCIDEFTKDSEMWHEDSRIPARQGGRERRNTGLSLPRGSMATMTPETRERAPAGFAESFNRTRDIARHQLGHEVRQSYKSM